MTIYSCYKLRMVREQKDEPQKRDYWLYYALGAALLAVIQGGLIWLNPFEWWAWIPSIAAFAFATMMYYHPDSWYRRMSASCLILAGGLFAFPTLSVNAEWGEKQWLKLLTDNSPLVTIGLLALSAFYGWLDFIGRCPKKITIWHSIPILFSSLIAILLVGGTISQQETKQHIVKQTISAGDNQNSVIGSNVKGDLSIGVSNENHGRLQDRYFDAVDENDKLKQRVADLEKEKAEKARLAGDLEKAAKIESGAKTGERSFLLSELIEEDAKTELFRMELKRNLADVAYLQGDIATAEKALQAILDANSADLDAINRMARIDKLRGNFADAKAGYKRLLKIAGDDQAWQAVAYGNLGCLREEQGEISEAKAYWEKSLQLFQEVGMRREIEQVQGLLNELEEE